MDIGKLIVSLVAVYSGLLLAGMVVSVASSGIQCQKTDIAEHAKQGAIWAAYPTGIYGLAVYFPVIRRFAVNTLKSLLGFSQENAEVFGVGYLMTQVS